MTGQGLSLEEFHRCYDGVKPYHEFWNGEAIQKSVPTRLHSIVQFLLALLLREAGFKAFPELELRLSPEWRPIPDVAGALSAFSEAYPTEPVDIVIEVLSPDDRLDRVREKCARYAKSGIQQIIVIDPEHRFGLEWSGDTFSFFETVTLRNGATLDLAFLWSRLDDETR